MSNPKAGDELDRLSAEMEKLQVAARGGVKVINLKISTKANTPDAHKGIGDEAPRVVAIADLPIGNVLSMMASRMTELKGLAEIQDQDVMFVEPRIPAIRR